MPVRSRIVIVTFAALCWRGAIAADSPVLDTFQQWLSAFNSGDAGKISAFWQKYGSRQLPSSRSSFDLRLRKATGGMSIFRITEQTQTHLVALMKEGRGRYSESIMDLAATSPPVVGRLIGRPVPPPDSYPSRASNDADLASKVREQIAQMYGTDAFSGAILIAHQGEVLLDQAWGDADIARNVRNTPETQFSIGSMNKMFTAVAILQLVSQGKLALDAPIAKYWPDYPNHDLAARVTVRELLDHTAGTGEIFVPEVETHRSELHTLADVVKLLGNRSVEFPPGTQWEYSNYGFILLGRLIELVSGEPYDRYVREYVFLPAGMLHTTPRPDTNHAGGCAIGYTHGPHGLTPTTPTKPEPPVAGETAAGGGYSTVYDLFLFAQALQSGKLLSPPLLKQATSWDVVHPVCGLGFSLVWNRAYGHAGAGPGANGELRIMPESGYVLVALANRDPMMAADMLDAITSMLPPDERGMSRSRNKRR
ncbi:MAG TPA: serine hydrolase domain-containing protein [Bryobacteraceae bacterium]|jgi:CubicO group peptidase (beta-lactamase class C family)|nr:serine hydrolase domain-containing protein [Bryobacteraceae bacterium]